MITTKKGGVMKSIVFGIIVIIALMNNPDIIIKDGGVNTSYEEATVLVDGELK